MTSSRITFVYEKAAAPLASRRYVAFVKELERYAGQDISIVCGSLHELLPSDGFIILHALSHVALSLKECDPEQQAQIASRLVAVSVDRTRIFDKILEPLSLAAALDEMSLIEWEVAGPEKPEAWGLYGRRDIGVAAGAACYSPFESERYCYLHSSTHRGLPHLLADYLAVLENTQKG